MSEKTIEYEPKLEYKGFTIIGEPTIIAFDDFVGVPYEGADFNPTLTVLDAGGKGKPWVVEVKKES